MFPIEKGKATARSGMKEEKKHGIGQRSHSHSKDAKFLGKLL